MNRNEFRGSYLVKANRRCSLNCYFWEIPFSISASSGCLHGLLYAYGVHHPLQLDQGFASLAR